MPGWELIDNKEKENLIKIFTKSNGVMFAHGFDKRRNYIFRVRNFEKAISKFLKIKYCVATTSGTMAQYVALKALGVKRGDEVMTQAFTFVATAESTIEVGAKLNIINIDETFNIDIKELEKKISNKTKVLVTVPMLGNPCKIDEIKKITKKYNVKILEDACESLGAKYKKKYVGTVGDVGIFSLDFAKTITTGEGGLIVTNNKKIYKFCREYIDHGHENNPKFPRGKDTRKFHGLNLRMTELQAAVGIAQLKKINLIIKKNKKNKKLLKRLISNNKNIKFRIILDKDELSDTLIFFLDKKEKALNFSKLFLKHGYSTKNLPDAIDWHFAGTWKHMKKYIINRDKTFRPSKNLLQRAIAIPIFVKHTEKEIKKLALTINEILEVI
jgi:8-amino-3,8-dideoxy-alpha-D-manno-octulosonate transaminase